MRAIFIIVLATSLAALTACSGADTPECADLSAGDCTARSDCTQTDALSYDLATYREEYGDQNPEKSRPCPSALNYQTESICVDAGWSFDQEGEPQNFGRHIDGRWRIYRLDAPPIAPQQSGFVECPAVHAELGESTAWEVCAYCTP